LLGWTVNASCVATGGWLTVTVFETAVVAFRLSVAVRVTVYAPPAV